MTDPMTGFADRRIAGPFQRDHATILEAVKKVEFAIEETPGYAAELEGMGAAIAALLPMSLNATPARRSRISGSLEDAADRFTQRVEAARAAFDAELEAANAEFRTRTARLGLRINELDRQNTALVARFGAAPSEPTASRTPNFEGQTHG